MADIFDLFTWAAAEDAKSAAIDAERAANEAKEKAQELIDRHDDDERAKTIWLINKMLQDIFYGKEVAYYNLARLKTFVHSENTDMNHFKYSYSNPAPPWPAFELLLVIFFGVWGFYLHGFWSYLSWAIGAYSLWKFLIGLKEWNYWKKKLPSYIESKQKEIDEMRYRVKILNNLYPMLSLYGISTKAQIDGLIKDTYEALRKKDEYKAKRSLRTLYALLMDMEVADNDEKITLMMYEHSEGLKKMINYRWVFCQEALAYHKQLNEIFMN